MRRVHAFEFNDSAWCPRPIRDAIVEALGRGLRWGRIYDSAVPVLAELLDRTGTTEVLDLCSGSGEPAAIFLEALERLGAKAPRFVLSDLFPNVPSFESVAARHPGKIEVVREPVDATDVPASVDRATRCVISAFHHFPPELAARILADAVAKRRAIFVLEAFPRDPRRLPSILPAMAAAALASPFVARRERLAKLLLTFVLPAVPLCGLWDALVSVLRVHSEAELRAMVAPLRGGYEWVFREVPFFPAGRAWVFYGVPG